MIQIRDPGSIFHRFGITFPSLKISSFFIKLKYCDMELSPVSTAELTARVNGQS